MQKRRFSHWQLTITVITSYSIHYTKLYEFEGIGFPELLMDKSMARSGADIYRKFSYAKYYGGELTDKFGEYNYNYYGHVYLTSDDEFSFIRQDKFRNNFV